MATIAFRNITRLVIAIQLSQDFAPHRQSIMAHCFIASLEVN
jgi:hypothetical protein